MRRTYNNNEDSNNRILADKYIGIAYDITIKFNKIKQLKFPNRKEGLYDNKIIKAELDPIHVDNAFEIEQNINELTHISSKLKKLTEAAIKDTLEVTNSKKQIEELNNQAFTLISNCEDAIIHIKENTSPFDTETMKLTKKNLKTSLTLKLHEIAKEIRDVNRNYLRKIENLSSQYQNNDWYVQQIVSTNDDVISDIQADKMISDFMSIENIAKSRDADILNIVKSMEKISSQFKQLSNMIIIQGTLLDRIDYNLQITLSNTKKGRKELQKALETGGNSELANKVIKIQLILIIFFLIIIFFKFRK